MADRVVQGRRYDSDATWRWGSRCPSGRCECELGMADVVPGHREMRCERQLCTGDELGRIGQEPISFSNVLVTLVTRRCPELSGGTGRHMDTCFACPAPLCGL